MARSCPVCGKPKAAAYARISDDQRGERLGVTDQFEDCWRRAEGEGWCVCTPDADSFSDNDIGALYRKPRPGFESLCDALAERRYAVLVARDDGRLTRNTRQAAELVELVERVKVRVELLWTEHWDLSTAAGRKRVRDAFSDATYEAERTGERVARARLRGAKRGLPSPGGQRAWGFRPGRLEHDPVEVEQVRDVARRLLAGESLRSASLRYGKQPKDVKRALLSPRMVGLRAYHPNARRKETPCTGTLDCPGCTFEGAAWQPVLDRDTHAAVAAILSARNRDRVAGVTARKYLLTGFVFCGVCGSRCHGYRVKQGKRHKPTLKYACWPAGHVVRVVGRLDAYVRDQLLLRAEVSSAAPEIDPALTGAVAAYEARRGELQAALAEPGAPVAALVAALREVEGRLREAQGRLAEATAALRPAVPPGFDVSDEPVFLPAGRLDVPGYISAGLSDVPGLLAEERLRRRHAWWEAADLRQRRVLLAEHVSRIVLQRNERRRGFEPSAVSIYGADGEVW